MRQFNSYGPSDPDLHFLVPRTSLVEQCVDQLVGAPHKSGHFFTIWGSRQTGKTWIMRRAIEEIRSRYGDRFLVKELSMQGVSIKSTAPPEAFLSRVPGLFKSYLNVGVGEPNSWEEFGDLFLSGGTFDRPLILLIDEFDRLPPAVIDELVSQFRALKLRQDTTLLHGLALVGVRAVLGVDSERGSPFNVQRSLQIPNLTHAEVVDLFRQYQDESHQVIEPDVVEDLFRVTRGQPGLIGWFGELLTEKYNHDRTRPIIKAHWLQAYENACSIEPNNTVLNLLKKAKDPRYLDTVVELFKTSSVPFSFDEEWCNYLYLNGVIDYEQIPGDDGQPTKVCRFSSPFVQHRLFRGFSSEMALLNKNLLPVDPRVDLTSILLALDLPALLLHYRDFLKRAKRSGHNPWHGHAPRADLHLREAVGHFHLYWWLTQATSRIYIITPEFPTGNGKVDLFVRYKDRAGVIEVKSFTQRWELPLQKEQAARYAKSRGLSSATLALFVPIDDEDTLVELSTSDSLSIDGATIQVTTLAIAAV